MKKASGFGRSLEGAFGFTDRPVRLSVALSNAEKFFC
jgi:hypothetical protein